MFEVGILVICNTNNYTYTNEKTLCVVVKNIEDTHIKEDISVKIIASDYSPQLGKRYSVESRYFREITLTEYFEMFPDAKKCSDFDNIVEEYHLNDENYAAIIEQRRLERIKKEIEKEKKRLLNAYNFTDEEYESLVKEITTLLKEYGYHPTKKGIDAFLKEWRINKGPIIKLFQNHPNYNGKYQITFDTDFDREINVDKACQFLGYVRETYIKMYECKIGEISYSEALRGNRRIKNIIRSITNILDVMDLSESNFEIVKINNYDLNYFKSELDRVGNIINRYRSTDYYFYDDYTFKREDYEKFRSLNYLIDSISFESPFIDSSFAREVNNCFPSIKAVRGQKLSRVINKICHLLEIDKDKNYNKEFAKFSDAVNPLSIIRHTVISCHPIDYLTMSFGNSWSSCHTIDKKNVRNMDNSYEGMYSGGTMSYMLDGTSVVFYTVDKKYDGDKLELEPKINRNMFHIGEDKIVQGRVYPQCNDDKSCIYEKFRNIMQKVIADCYGKPNMWKLKKGTEACEDIIESKGVHYRDYENFDDCNVSYLKLDDGSYNNKKIIVGHNVICPSCGGVHSNSSCIECSDCYQR